MTRRLLLLITVALMLPTLSIFSAESQGVLPLLQNPPRGQPPQAGAAPPESYVPPDGYVPDAETATKIGQIIVERYFGEIPNEVGVQFTATLQDGIWIIKRTVQRHGFDGGAEVRISRKDGTISFLSDK